MVLLTTHRLRLRDLDPSDADAMLRVEGDAEAVRYQSFEPRTADACRAYLARDTAGDPDRTCFDLAVTLDGSFIGRVGLDIKRPERSVGELWFMLDRAHWRRGLMFEAASALIDYGFRAHGLHRIFVECDPRNAAAVRLAEKLGMQREGLLRKHVWIKGEWCDSLYYGLLRDPRTPAGSRPDAL